MVEHPCAEGLSAACFKAYPKWARQALAYKLLHIILPKQLTRKLPITSRPLPFFWNPGWDRWFIFEIDPDAPPWLLPWKDWKPGDPLPPGAVLRPGETLPPGWTPPPAPPPAYEPGPGDIDIDPSTGPFPPLYAGIWEPGPLRGPGGTTIAGFNIGDLLLEQGTNNNTLKIGETDQLRVLAKAITTWMDAEIRAVDIKIGKNIDPTGTIQLELWITDSNYKPVAIVGSGQSNIKTQDSLPFWSASVDYTRFVFTGKPVLAVANRYAIVIRTVRDPEGWDYLTLGRWNGQSRNYYWDIPGTGWYSQFGPVINCRLWGIAL